MKVGVTLPVDDGLVAGDYLELARAAETHGYDCALAGEVAGPEAFSLLGLVAASTSRIRLGSGIVGAYSRSPTATAMGFATLASAAPGRVIAGIGASSPAMVRDWHGREFVAPLAVVEEFVAVLRRVWSGERVDVDGSRLRVRGFRAGLVPPAPIPVLVAAMNPAMLRLAGRIADGVFLTWTPPDEVPGKLALVREGVREAGRPPDSIWAAASFWGYAGPRQAEAMERMRRFILQYAMVPTHRQSFVTAFPQLERAEEEWRAGNRRAASRFVGDDVVHALCAVGGGEAVAARARALHAAGIELPVLLPPGAVPGDVAGSLGTISRVAAALGLQPGY